MEMALFAALIMVAQIDIGEISGRIFVSGGAPVCGACRVELEGLSGGVRQRETDDKGHFVFPNLRFGSYTIRVSVTGYRPFSQTVSLYSDAIPIQIELEPDHVQTTTAARSPQTVDIASLLKASRSAESLIDLSAGFLARSDIGSAVKTSLDAVRTEPKSAGALFSLGVTLYCGSMLDLSKDALLKAIKLDSKAAPARLLLINVYLRERNQKETLRHIDAHLKASPKSAEREDLLRVREILRMRKSANTEELEIPFSMTIGTTRLDVASSGCRGTN